MKKFFNRIFKPKLKIVSFVQIGEHLFIIDQNDEVHYYLPSNYPL